MLVDQAFNPAGAELTTTTPLADHQGSPRILYRGAANSAPAVWQSVDYAPFGRVTEIRDSNGQTTTADLDAAFGHHGSLLDSVTGLQLKGARWYSPGSGRFISVDPIHDGTNWYEAFGNDPVNYGDPSGLSPSFHPLSGGTLSAPRVGTSSILAGLGAAPSGSRNGSLASQPIVAPKYTLQSTSFDISLRTPPVNEGARLGAATQLATKWNAVTTKQYSAQHSIDTLPKRIAAYENEQRTDNRRSTSGNLYMARQELARAEKALPGLVTQANALAAEYSRRGLDSVSYTTFTPGEQVVGGQGLANVAQAVAWGGPVRGIESVASPFDFAAGFATGVLQGSLRGTIGAVAERQAGAVGAATPRTSNILANKASGDAARDVIAAREAPSLIEQTFSTVGGTRRVDVLKMGNQWTAIESKVGRTSLGRSGSDVRRELARDWWLRRQGQVDDVIWEFSPSAVTGSGGPTQPLLDKLNKLGFGVRINP